MTGNRKNPLEPQPATHRRDRVRERHVALAGPVHHADSRILGRQLRVQVLYHWIQAEQARGDSQHRVPAPTAGRLQAEIGAYFLKCGLDVSSTRIDLDHHPGAQGRFGGEEVLITVRPCEVADEDPSHRNQWSAAFAPVTRPGNNLDAAPAPSIPSDLQALSLQGARNHFGRSGQVFPLDSGTPLARVVRRRSHQIGSRIELADEGLYFPRFGSLGR